MFRECGAEGAADQSLRPSDSESTMSILLTAARSGNCVTTAANSTANGLQLLGYVGHCVAHFAGATGRLCTGFPHPVHRFDLQPQS